MKLHGYLRGSGRLGNIVCARVGRETIAKTHNPKKANPNTEKQVNERSRFKLITQLAASYAPVIAIPKEGNQSKRNRFVRRNYDILHAEGGQASIDLTQIQLTAGSVALPGINIKPAFNGVTEYAEMTANVASIVDKVAYVVMKRDAYGSLEYVTSAVITAPGTKGTFPWYKTISNIDGIIYAYGIRLTTEKATAKYGNYAIENARELARLVSVRALDWGNCSFTRTIASNILQNLVSHIYFYSEIKAGDVVYGINRSRLTNLTFFVPNEAMTYFILQLSEAEDIYMNDAFAYTEDQNGNVIKTNFYKDGNAWKLETNPIGGKHNYIKIYLKDQLFFQIIAS